MSDRNGPLSPRHDESERDALRETHHELLRDLLAGYADRELPVETAAQVDAHLVGCDSCRSELLLQESIRDRLTAERPAAPTPALRARLATVLEGLPQRAPAAPSAAVVARRSPLLLAAVAVAGWLLAAGLGIVVAWDPGLRRAVAADVRSMSAPVQAVPLLRDALSDYRGLAVADLPGRARDLSAVRAAVGFAVEPLADPAARLVGAWTTELTGEPAAVLAYRFGDELVVQYLVAEDAFYRYSEIRGAVAARHLLAAQDGVHALIAWPGATAGSIVVGPMKSRELAALWTTERSR